MNIIDEVLHGDLKEYNFTTIDEMDNIRSMAYFLGKFDLFDNITLDDGTYIELDNVIGCHSGGNGDFYSHKIRFEIL